MTRSEIEKAIERGEWRMKLIKASDPNGAGWVGIKECREILEREDAEKFVNAALELLVAEQKRMEGCGYEQIDDDQNIWKCDKCKNEWCFIEVGVIENDTDYCPKCGLQILRIITHGWDEDGNETTTINVRDLTEGESV